MKKSFSIFFKSQDKVGFQVSFMGKGVWLPIILLQTMPPLETVESTCACLQNLEDTPVYKKLYQ